LDSPQSFVYIDHQQFGRCRTNIKLNTNEIEAIKTILRISGKKRLDFSNPSLKTAIHNKFFNCRFSLDTTPINSTGFSLDIRKMNKMIFTLPELVEKGTLSSEMAGFLFFCVINRINITVTGETNTGKTTLINCLDLLVPKHFRKIYVEEAPESLDETDFNLHQLKYKVDPSLNDFSSSSKTREIYKLLHRNPDIVYLGEILRKEEAHAMFHCLSVGLRGFQTIHAKSIKSLINRWRYHFGIDPSCFNDLDIIVFLKHKMQARIISEISEIDYSLPTIEIHPIFIHDHENNQWILQNEIENFNIIKSLKLNDQEKHMIKDQISFFSKVIEFFASKKKYNLENQILLFKNLTTFIFRKKKSNLHIDWSELEQNWIDTFLKG
jgi:type IV secretory pathway ATPase VirB11/archaellum biosynthesis ATPase